MDGYSHDFDILHSLKIAPPKYDFSGHSINELDRCLSDSIVPLNDKLEALASYLTAAQRDNDLKKLLTHEVVRDCILTISKETIGASKQDRSKVRKLANMPGITPLEMLGYLDGLTADLYAKQLPHRS